MHRLAAFLIRDFYIETSYRVAFWGGLVGIFLNTFVFYFLSEFLGSRTSDLLSEYNSDYFAFVLIGLALGSYFGVGLTSFARALRQAQTTGTLEALLMTPTAVGTVITGSALWSYTYATVRVLIYLLIGSLFLGLNLGQANYLAALVILLLAIIAFASLGIIIASLIMIIKRGDSLTALFGSFANLVGGVFYPIDIMPTWLQTVAQLLPITHALRAMRLALLTTASWQELAPEMFILALFCLILFPFALILFRLAVNRARQDGSLAQY
ncbi:MAG: ABC transporter permease [Chloroflexota bacterium]